MSEVQTLTHEDLLVNSNLSKQEIREKIALIEAELKKHPQIELPLQHYFSNGVYAREMSVPKGILLTGKIHRFENMSIISQGEVTVISIDGVKHYKAPATFVSSPGVKRLIYAHENTVWTTVHATKETDIKKLETDLVADSYEEIGLLDHDVIKVLEEK